MATKFELTDEELNEVNGGYSQFRPENIGSWLSGGTGSELIYRIQKAYMPTVSNGQYVSQAAVLDRFWCNGSEAWYYGTVTENERGRYYDIEPPQIVHEDKMYVNKPF